MRKPLTDKDGEVRELTAADMRHFRPIQETDPGMLEAVVHYRKRGRPQVESPKMRIGFRLAADVVAGVRPPAAASMPVSRRCFATRSPTASCEKRLAGFEDR